MHQNYDHMEEINLVDLYQEEIDFLSQQNGPLQNQKIQ